LNFELIEAHDLIVYHVSIPVSSELVERVTALKLNEEMEMNPVHRLSDVFTDELLDTHVHVVVETPSGAWIYVVLSSLC
jgi:hypothetical protein